MLIAQGKGQFVRDFVANHPEGSYEDLIDAWHETGAEDSIAETTFYKYRKQARANESPGRNGPVARARRVEPEVAGPPTLAETLTTFEPVLDELIYQLRSLKQENEFDPEMILDHLRAARREIIRWQ